MAASGQQGAATTTTKWRLVWMTQSNRVEFFPIEARVIVPIRPGEEKAKVVSCVSKSFMSMHVVQLRFWWRRDEGEVNGAARWYQVTPTVKQSLDHRRVQRREWRGPRAL
jgi:hypothetical protein